MRSYSKGFTIIELLVVITIIGILATVILPALQDARDKAIDVKRIAEMDVVRKALEQYFHEYDEYPDDSVSNAEVTLMTIAGSLAPEFIIEVPVDPIHGDTATGYKYCASDDLQSYYLRVHLNDDQNATTTDYCGYRQGSGATSACPSAATDDLCFDRF